MMMLIETKLDPLKFSGSGASEEYKKRRPPPKLNVDYTVNSDSTLDDTPSFAKPQYGYSRQPSSPAETGDLYSSKWDGTSYADSDIKQGKRNYNQYPQHVENEIPLMGYTPQGNGEFDDMSVNTAFTTPSIAVELEPLRKQSGGHQVRPRPNVLASETDSDRQRDSYNSDATSVAPKSCPPRPKPSFSEIW